MHAFDYPGDENQTTVTMAFASGDLSSHQSCGFLIYDQLGKAVVKGEPTGTAGERAATVASDLAGRYVVQVHNYIDGLEMSYTLSQEHWVDIGGYRLRMCLAGEGGPTVVFEAGSGGSLENWRVVQPEISRFARTVSYDRAGLGKSDLGPQPRTIDRFVAELHTLLEKANIRPPYVLVGHSVGGMSIRLFAATYPDEVAGLVFVGCNHEDQWQEMAKLRTPEEWVIFSRKIYNVMAQMSKGIRDEWFLMPQDGESIRQVTRWPDVPAAVLTSIKFDAAMSGNGYRPEDQQINLRLQRQYVKNLPQAFHIVTKKSGHLIQLEEPHLVIDAVRRVVEAARSR